MINRNSLLFVTLLSFASLSTVQAQAENQEEAVQEVSKEIQFERLAQRLVQHLTGLQKTLKEMDNPNISSEIKSQLGRTNIALYHVTIKELINLGLEIKQEMNDEHAELGRLILGFLQSDFYAEIDASVKELFERIKELEAQNS